MRNLESRTLEMQSYLIKPREPTVLSHKKYHELSSNNLLLAWAVSCHAEMIYREATLTPGPGIGSDRPHHPKYLGYRKIQHRTGRCIIELSTPCGETGETGHTRRPLEGTPLLHPPPLPRANREVQIRLTNSGVPVSVIDNDADEIFPTDFTYQTAFPYVDPLNLPGIVNTEGESDEPLFRMTITRFTKLNSTSIGTFFSHALCTLSLDLPLSFHHGDENCLS